MRNVEDVVAAYAAAWNAITDGVDFGELADDGRLRRITGFFGTPR